MSTQDVKTHKTDAQTREKERLKKANYRKRKKEHSQIVVQGSPSSFQRSPEYDSQMKILEEMKQDRIKLCSKNNHNPFCFCNHASLDEARKMKFVSFEFKHEIEAEEKHNISVQQSVKHSKTTQQSNTVSKQNSAANLRKIEFTKTQFANGLPSESTCVADTDQKSTSVTESNTNELTNTESEEYTVVSSIESTRRYIQKNGMVLNSRSRDRNYIKEIFEDQIEYLDSYIKQHGLTEDFKLNECAAETISPRYKFSDNVMSHLFMYKLLNNKYTETELPDILKCEIHCERPSKEGFDDWKIIFKWGLLRKCTFTLPEIIYRIVPSYADRLDQHRIRKAEEEDTVESEELGPDIQRFMKNKEYEKIANDNYIRQKSSEANQEL